MTFDNSVNCFLGERDLASVSVGVGISVGEGVGFGVGVGIGVGSAISSLDLAIALAGCEQPTTLISRPSTRYVRITGGGSVACGMVEVDPLK